MRNAAVVAAVLVLAFGVPARGQQPQPTRRTVLGVVRDSATRLPLGGALVQLGHLQLVTDTAGRFRFQAVPDGPATFRLSQLGYASRIVTVLVGDDTPPLTLTLAPEPVPLPSISVELDSVVAHRLAVRRWSVPLASRAFDRATLLASNAQDMHAFVATRTGIQAGQCTDIRMAQAYSSRGRRQGGNDAPMVLAPPSPEAFASSGWTGCVWKPARTHQGWVVVHSAIFVDGKLIAVDKLHDYAPRDMFLLEVYGGGVMIQGYTTAWVERTWGARLAPIP